MKISEKQQSLGSVCKSIGHNRDYLTMLQENNQFVQSLFQHGNRNPFILRLALIKSLGK